MQRRSGILLHPSSLPTSTGIGNLGPACFEFLEFLQESGQTLWQILPLGPTGYGDSPYQCFSAFAGNPLLIDPTGFIELGLLTEEETKTSAWAKSGPVDFGKLVIHADKVFRRAFAAYLADPDPAFQEEFQAFYTAEGWWLHEYALFMTLKQLHNLHPWWEWEPRWRLHDAAALEELNTAHQDEILYHKFLQLIFTKQWLKVRRSAEERGIRIVGDLPIFVAYDSADVWCWPQYFRLNPDRSLEVKTGVPPDYFAEDGQLWGNPHYNWPAMQADNYWWWCERVSRLMSLVHTVRIDHFRGFEAAYEIPGAAETAREGSWGKAPGESLFNVLTNRFPALSVVAEDLGLITPEVEALKARFDFPGMKILQFGFLDGNAPFLPHNYEKHCVAFTGTHDNDTLLGFFGKADGDTVSRACRYLDIPGPEQLRTASIRALWRSSADWVIIPMQDWLGLGGDARMNVPATTGGNWRWRLAKRYRNRKDEQWLAELGRIYDRNAE